MGIEAIAQWFLIKESMTLGKLQVLCYCAYAWTLVFLNKRKTLKYRLFASVLRKCDTLKL